MMRPMSFLRLALPGLLAGLLAACGSTPAPAPAPQGPAAKSVKMVPAPRGGGYYKDDGPGDEIPANLDEIPDADPRWEPLHKWANRPYMVLGRQYVPHTSLRSFRQEGIASWYGRKFHGQKTSIGETYDMFAMTAAHPTLAIPSYVRVTNPANGRSVVVRVNDRGPFHADRIIDLSYTAAHKLGYINNGSTRVVVEAIIPGDATGTAYAAVAPAATPGRDEDALARQILRAESARAGAPAPGIYLQLGAFANADNAENLKNHLSRDLDWLTDPIRIHAAGNIHRLHMGPYASRAEAEQMAQRIAAALGYSPAIVTR